MSVSKEDIILRPARFSDVGSTATIGSITYFNAPVSRYIFPDRYIHLATYRGFFYQMHVERLYNPRTLCMVAVRADRPNDPLGFAQFIRVGDSAAAVAHIEQKRTPLLTLQRWFWTAWFWLGDRVRPFRHRLEDNANFTRYLTSLAEDEKKQWGMEERQDRWHIMSVVVRPDAQGLGIGKRFMQVVMEKAKEEKVIVGVESTPAGALLYRKFGFRKLQDHTLKIEEGGGFFIWEPQLE